MYSKRDVGKFIAALTLAGFCFILVAVPSAQADKSGVWKVAGKEISETKEVSAKADGELKIIVAAKETEFRCTTLALDDGLLFVKGESSGTLLLSGCTTFLNKVLSEPCKPVEPITAKVKDSLIVHGGKTYDLVSPAAGSTFALLKFAELCPLPDEVEIKGSTVLECSDAPCEKEQVTHLVKQALEALFPGDGLTYMGHTAKLAGSITLELSGTSKGSSWAGGITTGPAGNFRVEGTNIAATQTFLGEKDKDFTLLWTFVGTPIEILCQELAVQDGLLFVAGASSAELKFSSCETFISKSLSKSCKPQEPIVTAIKAVLLLHNAKTYALVTPSSGSVFTVLKFSAECALGMSFEIKGSAVVECSDAACETEQISHLVQQAPAELFPEDKIAIGANELRLDGGELLKLESGKKWSALS